MNDPELLRQRQAAEVAPEDPKPLYRYRVLALKAGAHVRPAPGDMVELDDTEDETRVVRVLEAASGPVQVTVRVGSKVRVLSEDDVRIVSPHRPAVLLGEDELHQRLSEDKEDPHDPRALETLGEVARRKMREGIGCAVDLFPHVEEGPDEALRKALTQVVRSRPFGEVEVDLLHRKHEDDEARALIELPALAASATEASTARDVLDRLEALGEEAGGKVAIRCGRNLVGAGGPAFVDAELRQRVAAMAREHSSGPLRVGLFLHAVPVLQSEEVLVDKALPSQRPHVRAGACRELARRGKHGIVREHAASESEPSVLRVVLEVLPAPIPTDLLAHCLKIGRKDAALEEAALLALPEAERGEEGAALLAPWFKDRKTSVEAALFAAGFEARHAGGILARLAKLDQLERVGLAVEALVRTGHESGPQALDAWGVELIRAGSWGEEIVDACGLMLGRKVDAREFAGRFLVEPPQHLTRRARALEAGLAFQRNKAELGELKRLLPTRLQRFASLEA